MRARTFFSNQGIIVLIENEHKEVFVYVREVTIGFASYNTALNWARNGEINGSSYNSRTN